MWPRMQCALHKGKAIHTANTSTRVHLHADTMMATAYVKEIAYWTRQNMSGQHITVLHQFQQSASVFTSAGLLFTKLFLIIHKALHIIIHNAIIIIHWALHYYPQSKYYSHNLSCTILLNNIHGTLKVFSRALSILLSVWSMADNISQHLRLTKRNWIQNDERKGISRIQEQWGFVCILCIIPNEKKLEKQTNKDYKPEKNRATVAVNR